jgi:lipoprotein LprG
MIVVFEQKWSRFPSWAWIALCACRATCLTVLAGALLISCSGTPARPVSLPEGSKLLTDSADAMGHVTSAQFRLKVNGDLQAVRVQEAQAALTREGEIGQVSATAIANNGGQQVHLQYILTGGDAYLKSNTGWQLLPKLVIFDPSVVLDSNRGLASMLARATDEHTDASESVSGTASYRVRANVPTDLLQRLAVATAASTMPATLWVAQHGNWLLKVQIGWQGASAPTELTLTLSDFNTPIAIKPPPVP